MASESIAHSAFGLGYCLRALSGSRNNCYVHTKETERKPLKQICLTFCAIIESAIQTEMQT